MPENRPRPKTHGEGDRAKGVFQSVRAKKAWAVRAKKAWAVRAKKARGFAA